VCANGIFTLKSGFLFLPCMVRLFTLIFLLMARAATAQNLVPNPSFEDVLQPLCSYLVPGENLSEFVNLWRAPTGGTTDFWTSTPTFPGCSRNIRNSNLLPRTGTTCIGMYIATANINSLSNVANVRPYREYAQVKLQKPLVKGKVYYAEMYISLLDRSALAANNMGMLFTTTPVQRDEDVNSRGGIMFYKPQVNNPNPLNNSGKWYKVSGCFVADDAHQYLTIGNFFAETATTFLIANRTSNLDPYYLIDDVFVGDPENELPALSLGRDTVLCGNQSITYRFPTMPGIAYFWQDGTTNPTYTVRKSGQYIIKATTSSAQCELIDTVQVRLEPTVKLAADTVFCADEPITIKPIGPGLGNLVWSDGSRDSLLQLRQSGTFWVRRLSNKCPSADTLVARAVGCPGAVPNVFTPNGDGINDTFRIPGLGDVPWRMTILNRWGNVVYEANPYPNDWNGGNLPSGVYYFQLNTPVFKRNYTGTVTIFRE
jgi:gliding motility-associated-like protein